MRNEQTDPAYILDIFQAASDICEFTKDINPTVYLKDKKLRAAIERKLEIVGEAAGKMSETFRNAHQEIPWRPMISLRNVIAHDYGDIKHEKIWEIVSQKIPELVLLLKPFLPEITHENQD